jgi:hypothetical protein
MSTSCDQAFLARVAVRFEATFFAGLLAAGAFFAAFRAGRAGAAGSSASTGVVTTLANALRHFSSSLRSDCWSALLSCPLSSSSTSRIFLSARPSNLLPAAVMVVYIARP